MGADAPAPMSLDEQQADAGREQQHRQRVEERLE
jgi:hypothetical protein